MSTNFSLLVFGLLNAKCYDIYMNGAAERSGKLFDRANALLIYFSFLVSLNNEFFEMMTFTTHVALISHAIFIIIVEIIFILIKIKEYFDKKK